MTNEQFARRKAWLERKAARAKKREEEKIQLTKEGTVKTAHIGDVKTMRTADLIANYDIALKIASDLNCMRDKKGNPTSIDLEALSREIVRRYKNRLRKDKVPIEGEPTLGAALPVMRKL